MPLLLPLYKHDHITKEDYRATLRTHNAAIEAMKSSQWEARKRAQCETGKALDDSSERGERGLERPPLPLQCSRRKEKLTSMEYKKGRSESLTREVLEGVRIDYEGDS